MTGSLKGTTTQASQARTSSTTPSSCAANHTEEEEEEEVSMLAHMRRAFDMAHEAARREEVPIGCVLVKDDVVVATGFNRTNETRDGTRHAEMEAMDYALKANIPLKDCELYVTCEPCVMCAAALSLAGVRRAVYGCANDKFGGCGTVLAVHEEGCGGCGQRDIPGAGHSIECIGGVMKDEAVALLRTFYERGNPGAPKPHRKVVPRTSDN
mmetsp:Transcript_9560/g.21668  ORF Transcript_9560/g.21668 Transcript_9560/m.21668 type:complete len:211 (+) Transcript_9560:114-746(+)